ncbi:MAG: hypothetical protein HKL98_05995 [Burkholderiales bacterium]|nr:hypothetical protein [Burkholderiales bacterium]
MTRLLALPAILASFAGIFLGLRQYPLDPWWLGAALAAYAVLLWCRPHYWLFFIPAILPVADLSPWSGWIHFEELDFFLLVTIALGYLRLAGDAPVARLTAPAILLGGLFLLSCCISAWIGFSPYQAPDANTFSSYLNHYNSLRVFKPVLWIVLLMPLLKRSMGNDGLERLFIPGLLTGLALVSLFSFWERWTYTGLMDFASDYRITASFPEMHLGGAAIDAFLAMTMPLAAYAFFRVKPVIAKIAAAMLLVAGTYAVMVTFSRGLYLGLGLSAAILLLAMTRSPGHGRGHAALFPILAFSGLLLVHSFATAGYRGLLAGVLVTGATLFLGDRTLHHKPAMAAILVIFLPLALILSEMFGKGAYVSFVVAFFMYAAGYFLSIRKGEPGGMLAGSGLLAMMIGALLVDRHWGGDVALFGGAWIDLYCLALLVFNRSRLGPFWRGDRQSGLIAVFFLLLAAFVIPVMGNYYVADRFAQTKRDFGVRISHWEEVLSVMNSDWSTRFFGMGMGSFPETNFWKSASNASLFRFEQDRDGHFLRFSGSDLAGEGEPLRFAQRISVDPYREYFVSLEARTAFPNQFLNAAICQKLLIYEKGCAAATVSISPDGKWQSYRISLHSGQMGDEPWYSRPMMQFYLADASRNGYLDIRKVSLSDGFGNVLRNGDFAEGMDRWFFTSDHEHLAWHEKDLFLHVFFDQGWFGLLSFGLLCLYALARLLSGSSGAIAMAQFASLFSLLVVGIFDSVLDFPRIALLVYLLLISAMIEPVQARGHALHRGNRRKPGGASIPVVSDGRRKPLAEKD